MVDMCESVRSRRLAQPVASDGARKSNLVGTRDCPRTHFRRLPLKPIPEGE